MAIFSKDVIDRFWSKVDIKSEDECWEWLGPLRGKGYGYIVIEHKKIKANRFSWIITNGLIPTEKLVLHNCDNSKCVNPNHLYIGSHSDNMRDRCSRYNGMIGRTNRFTEEKIQIIKLLYSKGITQRSIAERLGLSQSYISMLIHNKRGTNARYL